MTTPEEPTGASTPEPHTDWWGDTISEDQQAELDALSERQRTWAEQPAAAWITSPLAWRLKDAPLTGAEVFWLAQRALAGPSGDAAALTEARTLLRSQYLVERLAVYLSELHLEGAFLPGAHLEGANLFSAQLQGAYLGNAHLEGAFLPSAQLQGAYLGEAQLQGADLGNAQLEGANLGEAQLEGAFLPGAHLERADLNGAHLERANLREAQLQGANLSLAHLEGANLRYAHLEGANLRGTHLEGKIYATNGPDLARIRAWASDFPAMLPPTDLREAVLDAATTLNNITLGDAQHGAVRVADLRWGEANLAVIDWTPLIEPAPQLGDERAAWAWKPAPFEPPTNMKSRKELRAARATHDQEQAREKLEVFRAAVRANRQLATALRDQGMGEEADQFAYRAQVLQRQVFWLQHKRGRATFSWFLDRVAGHGYKPQRSLYTYLLVLSTFTVLYMLASAGILTFGLSATQLHQLPWYEALVLSVASFHGRGFFQPVQSPGDPIAILAAIEAVFGLFIEVSFIATFTQRFFGK